MKDHQHTGEVDRVPAGIRPMKVAGELRAACRGGGVGVAAFEYRGELQTVGVRRAAPQHTDEYTGEQGPRGEIEAMAAALAQLQRLAGDDWPEVLRVAGESLGGRR